VLVASMLGMAISSANVMRVLLLVMAPVLVPVALVLMVVGATLSLFGSPGRHLGTFVSATGERISISSRD
jgi:hypothetical protein